MEEGLSNTELYTMGGLPGAGLGGQCRRGSIIASPRRTAVLRTRQAEENIVEEMTSCTQCICGEVSP